MGATDQVAPWAFVMGFSVVFAQGDAQVIDELFAERTVDMAGAVGVMLPESGVGDKVPVARVAEVVIA